MNIKLFRWERAFEIAKKYKVHEDTVIGYRRRYLEQVGMHENIKSMAQAVDSVRLDLLFFVIGFH